MKKLVLGLAVVTVLVFAAAAGALAEKVLKMGVGDVVFIKGSRITCSVANPGKQMVCFKHKRNGHPVPGSYGTTASNKFAGIVRFKHNGKPVIVTRKNNR
jgi:hypothetical protein